MAGLLPHLSMRATPGWSRVYGARTRPVGRNRDGRPLAGPAVVVRSGERVGLVAARRDLDGALGERLALRVALDARPGVGDDRGVVGARGRIELDDPGALGDL